MDEQLIIGNVGSGRMGKTRRRNRRDSRGNVERPRWRRAYYYAVPLTICQSKEIRTAGSRSLPRVSPNCIMSFAIPSKMVNHCDLFIRSVGPIALSIERIIFSELKSNLLLFPVGRFLFSWETLNTDLYFSCKTRGFECLFVNH